MKYEFLSVCVIILLLAGCSTPVQKYTLANESQPYAELQSQVHGAESSIQIYVMGEGGCGFFNFDHIKNQRVLFSIENSTVEPQGYIRVAVDKPLRLRYMENIPGGRECEFMIETKLEAGKKYTLYGGFQYKDGFIPILLGSRSCNLGVRSDANNQPIAIKHLFKSMLCEK